MNEFDVVVLGEPMVERHRDSDGRTSAPDAVSGDAFNAACAAALGGARVALLTVLGDDDAAELVLAELTRRGVDTRHVRRAGAPTGAYTVSTDTRGRPRFSYHRGGSAASTLALAHLEHWAPVLRHTPVLVTSGITAALSATAAELVPAATAMVAAEGGSACYDVNFRPELTDPDTAARTLRAVAPSCRLVKIASPGDSVPLLGATAPETVSRALRELTDAAILVSRAAEPLTVTEGHRLTRYPSAPVPTPVDTTGAGDVLLGTVAARLALGEPLGSSVPLAVIAAGLSTRHRGGAPRAPLDEVRTVLSTTHPSVEPSHALEEESRS